mmetsp:Transcript_16974/g.33809  ORF Transcript_16974/g.33809 Transcript_16974/m.33809 type:complete len:535 (+) Transcript_16974:284-1888(+)
MVLKVSRHENKTLNIVALIKNAATKNDTMTALSQAKNLFNHNNEEKHDMEVRAGAATALYKLLSITIHMNGAANDAALACQALELVLGCSKESRLDTFEVIGERLISLLTIVIQRCINGTFREYSTALNSTKIIRYFSQVDEVKIAVAKQKNALSTLVNVVDKCEHYEARVEGMHAIISLSFEPRISSTLCECTGLLELFTTIALDFEESPQMKQWVAAGVWNLCCEPCCRIGLCRHENVLNALTHLVTFKNSKTKEYAVSAIRQLSLDPKNMKTLVCHNGGTLFRQVIDVVTEERVADNIVLKALETLNNTIGQDTGGLVCVNAPLSENSPGLIVTLTSVVTDNNVPKLRMLALAILIKVCNTLNTPTMISVGDTELVALVACLVTIAKANRNEYRPIVFIALKTLAEEKCMRQPMAECPGLLDVVSWTFNSVSAGSDEMYDAMTILNQLVLEEENRATVAENDIVLTAVANFLSSPDVALQKRAENIILCLAQTPDSQELVARNKALLSAILQGSKSTDDMKTVFKTFAQFM